MTDKGKELCPRVGPNRKFCFHYLSYLFIWLVLLLLSEMDLCLVIF